MSGATRLVRGLTAGSGAIAAACALLLIAQHVAGTAQMTRELAEIEGLEARTAQEVEASTRLEEVRELARDVLATTVEPVGSRGTG